MKTYNDEIQFLLERARQKDLTAEVYLNSGTSTSVRAQGGEVEQFTVADSRGLGLRVVRDGRVGYSYSESLERGALEAALDAAANNALLQPENEGWELACFSGDAPELPLHRPELREVPVPEKIAKALELEKIAKGADPRIKNVTSTSYGDSEGLLRIANTLGVDRLYRSSSAWMATVPLVSEGGQNKNYYQVELSREFARLDPEAIARQAVSQAVRKLGAREVASGSYPVVFAPEVVADLLGAFSGSFSAKQAQEGKSQLKGKLGTTIASPVVTVIDDPLCLEGWGARPFDSEGCPSRSVPLVEQGVFRTFLHNSQTARREGVESTGHAARGGYKGTLDVAPSNLILKPGTRSAEELLHAHPLTLEITEVTGLHAGVNGISGDFSLQAEGFLHQGGESYPIHNFTVSGNFYRLLEAIEQAGSDLEYQPGGVAAPSVLVESLAIAGK